MMRYAVVLVIAIAAIWLASRSSLPSMTLSLGAGASDEDPTDIDAAVATHAPAATPFAVPYDPWNPPPVDPFRPHLPDLEPEPDLAIRAEADRHRAFSGTLDAAMPALLQCYRTGHPTEALTIRIGVALIDDRITRVLVVDADDQPVPPPLGPCVGAIVQSFTLVAPSDTRYSMMREIVLTPEPGGSGSG